MIVTLDSRRRFVVPGAVGHFAPGDQFEARYDEENGTIRFRRIRIAAEKDAGMTGRKISDQSRSSERARRETRSAK